MPYITNLVKSSILGVYPKIVEKTLIECLHSISELLLNFRMGSCHILLRMKTLLERGK